MMTRLIKRYGSRKLYDTSESRYVGLEDVASFVRSGDEIQVIENKTGNDVTAAILTQIISEEGRSGAGVLSAGFLHDLLRMGERAVKAGEDVVEAGLSQARRNVDDLARLAADKIKPHRGIGEVRTEMDRLRTRLESLEAALHDLDETTSTD